MFRTAGTLLTALTISAGMVFAQPATKYVEISFNLISPITLHEPVAVDVAIRNLVSRPISIDLGGGDKTFFHFKTITPYGRQIEGSDSGARNKLVGARHDRASLQNPPGICC